MAAVNRRQARVSLLRGPGLRCQALCARRDILIRRKLLKNDKGTTKQLYTSTSVVDNELLQLSLRLFKNRMTGGHAGAQKRSR